MKKYSMGKKNARMAAIKSKDTKPELILRRALHARGHRYRLHASIPGRPDLVFTPKKLAVFMDGDFWHGHDWPNLKPKLKDEFWVSKIANNIERDKRVNNELAELGWKVIRVWEHEVLNGVDDVIRKIEESL